jgi:hypothetical protein
MVDLDQLVNNMIGISGYARSGKDTFGEALQRILKEYGVKAKTYALATQLKIDIDFLTKNDFRISALTKDDAEKIIIRPLLVGYGESWRKSNPDHWIEILDSNFEPKTLPIITDIRYENEADWILKNQGFLLNLKRHLPDGALIEAANKEEEKNAPLVQAKCSFDLVWQTIEDQKIIDDLVESFIISVLEDKLESWKAIYPL